MNKIGVRALAFLIAMLSVTASAKIADVFAHEIAKSLLKPFPAANTTYLLVMKPGSKKRLAVTATAYTSHIGQTDSTPNIAAWGDRLRPGMKVIAVSRDLLNKYGLERGSKVKIQGEPGYYIVLDKMNKRWRKKIDIYMGKDKRKAYKWGSKKVTIEWEDITKK